MVLFPSLGNGKPWCEQLLSVTCVYCIWFCVFNFPFYIRSGVSLLTVGVNPYFTFEKEKYTLGTGVSYYDYYYYYINIILPYIILYYIILYYIILPYIILYYIIT